MRRPALLLLLSASLSSIGWAAAQPLAALAPAETFLTLGWTPGAPPQNTRENTPQNALTRDLGALDWPRVGRTLEALAPLTGDSSSETMLRLYGYLFQGQQGTPPPGNDLFANCPEWRALERTYPPMPDLTADDAFDEALLSVSTSTYNPVPAVTATLRVEPTLEAQFAATHRALIRCGERSGTEIVRLQEGNVPLIVLGNAGDFPVVLSRVKNLFIVGTNPEVVRSVVRRVAGSDEANLAETPFYRQNQALLAGNGMSLSLDAAALGGSVESLGGTLTGAQSDPLLRRAVAALRTLGSFAGRLHSDGGAVTLSTRLNVNPAGGDRELAALLTCRCPAPAPTFAPETSVSVSSVHLQPRRMVAYLEGWVNLAGRAAGENVSLQQLAQQVGVDLDVALLDWLGSGVTSIVLEPFGTDLGTLLYGQAQVLALETRGSEAAKRGLAALGRAVQQGVERNTFGETDGAMFAQVARETYRYRGTDISRLRFGPTTDLGTAFVGDTLLVGTPASALESVLDTVQGRTGALTDAEPFVQFRQGAPEVVTQLSYSDLSPHLQGFADVARLASQPLAFAAAAGLSTGAGTGAGAAEPPSFADLLHLTELLPNVLTILGEHTGTLTSYTWVEDNARRSLARLNLR